MRAAACSIIITLTVLVAACGKRGDPLPPLRPVPAAAEAVVVRQVGSVIELEWRAPSRNQDRTTENVELREVRILRRIVDLDALVEAQTRPLVPLDAAEELTSAEVEPGAEPPPDPVTEPTQEPVAEPPPEPVAVFPEEPVAETGTELAESTEPTEDEAGPDEPSPTIPQRPALEIPPFASEAKVIATLPSAELGETLSYEEDVEPGWVGKRVEYALIYSNRKKRASPLSSIAQIEPLEALEIPGAPVASVGDGRVELRWEAGGRPDEAYFAVYRRAGGAESYPETPLNPTPLVATELIDESIVFGRAICYVVRRTVPPPAPPEEETEPEGTEQEETEQEETGEQLEPEPMPTELVPVVPPIANPVRIESLPSEETCLTPEDTFAPDTPTGLAGVSLENGVLLTWDVVETDDLGGYRVYRAPSADGPFELLNDEIVNAASFTDETAEPGRIYYYAVTAVDSTDRVNESPRSELAEARRLSP